MKLNSLIKSLIITGVLALAVSACESENAVSGSASVTPGVPSGIDASRGTLEDSVVITWEAADDAEYYVVYKAIDSPESFRVLATRVTGLTYSDTPVSSGRTFYYRVAAGNGNKWSNTSTEVKGFALKGTPMPPASLTIPVNQIGQVTLAWDAVINADSYNIYRCDTKFGTYTKINSEAVTASEFTDNTAVADKKYYYKIVSVNEHGEGTGSIVISGYALQQIPVWPTSVNLSASNETYGEKVRIEWAAAQYASSYTVYRAEASGGEYVAIAQGVTGLVYEDRDTSLADKTLYYYTVSAVSSGGQAGCGTEAGGAIDKSKPAQINPPKTVEASMGLANKITITWSEVITPPANGGYSVYRSTSSSFTSPVKIADKISALTFDDTTMYPVSDTITYYYKVTAWSKSGENYMESGFNAVAAEGNANPDKPGVPVNITSSMNYTNGSITVSWNAADTWTKNYKIYRSDNGIDGDYNIVSQNQTGTSITESIVANEGTVEAGVEYFYQVRAVNSLGQESALSTGTSAIFTLRVPTGLSAKSTYNWDWNCTYTYTITWTAVKGATGYEVGYYYDKEWHLIDITSGSTTTVSFKSPNHGAGTYKIRIRAVNTTPDIEGDSTIYSEYSAQVQP